MSDVPRTISIASCKATANQIRVLSSPALGFRKISQSWSSGRLAAVRSGGMSLRLECLVQLKAIIDTRMRFTPPLVSRRQLAVCTVNMEIL